MDDYWKKVEEALMTAAAVSAAEREVWLAEYCAGDAKLKAEVESLLALESCSDNFLEKSPDIYFAQLLPADETSFSGKNFGHYKIIREIGRGGMGAVFLAERNDGAFEQRAALKIVRQTIPDAQTENRFRLERQILASLNHPNIARLLDGGVSQAGEPFLVMEFIAGKPLLEFAAARKLAIEERLKLFLKICAAVSFAHRNLIVHRDIKPSNILVARDGEPKLLDFGLAKILDFENDAQQTATAFRAMTPAYASPEQLRGENVTTVSDIYSLGVVLYELLTGSRPFAPTTNSFEEIVRLISTSEPIRPSSAISNLKFQISDSEVRSPKSKIQNPKSSDAEFPSGKEQTNLKSQSPNPKSLRGDLDNIILTALRKEPERRYESVETFAADIERHLNGLPVSARPQTVRYRAGKFIRRHRSGVAAASFIFLAVVSGLIVSLWQADVARRQRDSANRERLKAERINKFLRQMLSFSNQSVTSVSPVAEDKNVTVNEMLDEIAPQIETEFADAPEIRAQILRTIGSSYASQGVYEKAENYLRRSLETPSGGESDAESVAAMIELGVLLYRQNKLDESSRLLEKAIAFYRTRQENGAANFNPAQFALALDYLGIVKFYQGEPQTAAALSGEAYKIVSAPEFPAEEHFTRTFIKSDYGGVSLYTGEPERGETLLREAVKEYRQISGKPRWELGATLLVLGISANLKNNPKEAEAFLTESEQILRQTLGDKNVYLANNLNWQAVALNHLTKYQKAEEKARQSLDIYQNLSQNWGYLSALPMTTLGIILTSEKRAREGENYLRQALAIFDEQPKKSFAAIVQNKIGLSKCLAAQKRFAEAKKVALEAREEATQNLGAQHPLVKIADDVLDKLHEK